MDKDEAQVQIANPFENAIGISITSHTWGIRRKVQRDEVHVQGPDGASVDKEVLSLTKRLLKSSQYDAICTADRRIRDELEKVAVPSQLRRGTYLIPIALLDDVDAKIEAYRQGRVELIEAFIAAYDQAKKEAEKKLGPLYKAHQYPPSEDIRACFAVEVDYIAFGLPAKLESVSEKIYRRESARVQAKMEEAAVAIRGAARAGLQQLVSSMADTLTGRTASGASKRLRDEAIEHLNEWLDAFKFKNLTGDAELEDVVEKARKLMQRVDGETLRSDKAMRASVGAEFARLAQATTKLVEEIPRRKFSFDDDE